MASGTARTHGGREEGAGLGGRGFCQGAEPRRWERDGARFSPSIGPRRSPAGRPEPDHGSKVCEAPASGFALLRAALDEEELLLLAVVPHMRRRGLGAKLLARVFDAAKGRGTRQIMLEMRRGNNAESLYRQAGFQDIGIRPNYYRTADGGRIDALTFRCLLT